MPPKKPNTTIFSVLILVTLLIIITVVTITLQNRNNEQNPNSQDIQNRVVSTTPEQLPMIILKPRPNQTITMPTIFDARVKTEANTKDLSATLSVNGQNLQDLRVRKTPSGDIFLSGNLTGLNTGTHILAINLYYIGQEQKNIISNAQYKIKVQ